MALQARAIIIGLYVFTRAMDAQIYISTIGLQNAVAARAYTSTIGLHVSRCPPVAYDRCTGSYQHRRCPCGTSGFRSVLAPVVTGLY